MQHFCEFFVFLPLHFWWVPRRRRQINCADAISPKRKYAAHLCRADAALGVIDIRCGEDTWPTGVFRGGGRCGMFGRLFCPFPFISVFRAIPFVPSDHKRQSPLNGNGYLFEFVWTIWAHFIRETDREQQHWRVAFYSVWFMRRIQCVHIVLYTECCH